MQKRESDLAANGRPRALFLAPESPYPMIGGGAIRAASLLEFLAQSCEVDVLAFRQPDAVDPSPVFPHRLAQRLCVIDLPLHSRQPVARVWRNTGRMIRRMPPLVDRFAGFSQAVAEFLDGQRYDVAVVEHFWCAQYWQQVAPHSRWTVLDLHNVESAWHRRSGEVAGWPSSLGHRIFERSALALERLWLPRYSLLLAASPDDAARVRQIVPGTAVAVYPNTVPLVAQPRPPEEELIVFSGTLDYAPNQSAVRYFTDRIWPRLRERWPDLRWRLVGKNPGAVQKYVNGDQRIECSGPVDDAIRQLAAAKVAIVPLLAGSGTRLKIVEAWAAGRPVVSTRVGAEGLPVRHGENIFLADDPDRFADAVSDLLGSPSLRQRVGRAGRDLYEREFTWPAAWNRLEEAFQRLLGLS